MKQLAVMAGILTVMALLPHGGTEIGELKPVEVLYVTKPGYIEIETDTGERGIGRTLEKALADLEETTVGHLYLNTAEYLLVAENALELVPEMKAYLRPSVQQYLARGKIELDQAGAYLKAHPAKDEGLTLTMKEGRFYLTS